MPLFLWEDSIYQLGMLCIWILVCSITSCCWRVGLMTCENCLADTAQSKTYIFHWTITQDSPEDFRMWNILHYFTLSNYVFLRTSGAGMSKRDPIRVTPQYNFHVTCVTVHKGSAVRHPWSMLHEWGIVLMRSNFNMTAQMDFCYTVFVDCVL